MIETNSKLGGEPSGHILLTDYAKTGDGLLTCIKILYLLKKSVTGRKKCRVTHT